MTERRLAAILVADVVGYSKLVGSDEAGTLAKLSALRREIIDPTIGRHSGRLFKAVGDGFLVEFASAVQALEAARAIQQANTGRKLPLRIGIHVGDVVVQGDDLMGDGVNIAARLEGVAEAGGIAISRQVHDQVRDRLDLSFEDKGRVELKNVARPVHVFVVAGPKTATPALSLALPDKPSIAVLPFQNMSGDPEQEYFADGMVEDIITALSRFKSLFVIARNSSFTYKGKAVDVKQVGRELGVRYVLEGSVRKAAGKVRITGQLIDAATSTHLWADRFDGSLEDIFDLQDRLTATTVGAVAPAVDRTETERSKRKPLENLDAYDCYLRGRAKTLEQTREAWDEALRLFHRAIELDPGLAVAYAMAANYYHMRTIQGWVDDRDREASEARRLAMRAAALGHDDAISLCWAGHALATVCRELEAGVALIDQALAINPNLAAGWMLRGWNSVFLGEHELALEQFSRGLRLSPLDPSASYTEGGIAAAHLFLGRYDEATDWGTRSVVHRPTYGPSVRILAAANALAGKLGEARKLAIRIRELDPAARLTNIKTVMLYQPKDIERVVEGLRLAGLPE